ncbi:unnamed protein product [Allacma fusca]|uniref:Uncharacterized protein n=1 Tax=Allacma fusca TaxID=39272 RepID=A0A8J2JCE7_9HEXA|nr:unnamed protein product [Allacma fusca]
MAEHAGYKNGLKDWESIVQATLQKYEMLAGGRKIPLVKSLIHDIKHALLQELDCCKDFTGSPEKRCRTEPVQRDSYMKSVKEAEVVKESMQIKNVLATIFCYVQVQDLKNFRLVNTLWNEQASLELGSRTSVRIRLLFSEIDQTFVVGSRQNCYYLDELFEVICRLWEPNQDPSFVYCIFSSCFRNDFEIFLWISFVTIGFRNQ